VTTSLTDTTDNAVNEIVEAVITALQRAETRGDQYLPARDLYRARYGDHFREALRRAERAGRVASRRAKVGKHRSRRYVALPHNERFLPGGAR